MLSIIDKNSRFAKQRRRQFASPKGKVICHKFVKSNHFFLYRQLLPHLSDRCRMSFNHQIQKMDFYDSQFLCLFHPSAVKIGKMS